MRKQRKNHPADFQHLAKDARALVTATAEVAEQKVVDARKRLANALESGGEIYEDVRETVAEKARAADEYVREKPYQSLAIAVCAAVLVGYLLGRRR